MGSKGNFEGLHFGRVLDDFAVGVSTVGIRSAEEAWEEVTCSDVRKVSTFLFQSINGL